MTDHAYHSPHYPNEKGPGREFNPDSRHWEPTEAEERAKEGRPDDDETGYNWGPPPNPNHIPESHVGGVLRQADQFALRVASGEHYDDYDHAANDWEHQEAHEDLGHHASMDDQFQ